MKKLFIKVIFAKVFQAFKVSAPWLYGTVIAPAIIWLQTQMFDPQVIEAIRGLAEVFPEQADTITAIIKWLPMVLLALTGTHTNEIVEQDRQRKKAGK